MAYWAAAIDASATFGSAWLNSSAQSAANRTNVRIAKENRDFTERMSNTAVQRRRADIEAAGGNPAAAFVNGGEASAPVVTPAHVEAPKVNLATNFTAAKLANAQIDNVNAQTQNTSADTKLKNTQWQILESYGGENSAQDVVRKKQENEMFGQNLRKAIADADISETTASLLREKQGLAISLLDQQARIGEINAQSTERIARTLGVGGKDAPMVAKLLLELAKLLMSAK